MATEQTKTKPNNNPTTTKVSSKKEERTFKIKDNKPLLGVIAVIGLIMLTAIGVGLYALISGVTDGDDNPKEDEQIAQASQEDSEDSSDDANDNEDSSETEEDTNSEEQSDEETESSDETESNSDSQDEDSSEDQQDVDTSENENENSDNSEEETDESEESSSAEDATVAENNSDENSTDEGDSEGNVNANGAVSVARKISSLTQEAFEKSLANQAEINESGVWYATDYESGDVFGDSHQVQLGDTLWEIAEGLYGDGAMWTQIEAANFDSIGYLPNGQHALITPGTVLVLPSP